MRHSATVEWANNLLWRLGLVGSARALGRGACPLTGDDLRGGDGDVLGSQALTHGDNQTIRPSDHRAQRSDHRAQRSRKRE